MQMLNYVLSMTKNACTETMVDVSHTAQAIGCIFESKRHPEHACYRINANTFISFNTLKQNITTKRRYNSWRRLSWHAFINILLISSLKIYYWFSQNVRIVWHRISNLTCVRRRYILNPFGLRFPIIIT